MTLNDLIGKLILLEKKVGKKAEVDILTETESTGQVEQKLGDLAISQKPGEDVFRVKLLPEGF